MHSIFKYTTGFMRGRAAVASPQNNKWITGLTAQTLLADAARRVLSLRLAAVVSHLALALQAPFDDPEHVHQLRVSTRRTRAALDIFADCLPESVARSARRYLRDIRRAAGEARDWDVFLDSLPTEVAKRSAWRQPGLDFVTGFAIGQRVTAQDRLTEASPDYPFAIERVVAETVAAVRKPASGPGTLGELGRAQLGDLLKELEHAASQDVYDYEHLHQVRITGKRLRYAMEVFVDCFGPALRETLYPAIEEMQDILGAANDSVVAAQRMQDLAAKVQAMRAKSWKRFKPAIEYLINHHQKQLQKKRQEFEDWWAKWQQSRKAAHFLAMLRAPQPAPSNRQSRNSLATPKG
jgi:CHAD domain-containing protein